MQEISYLPGEGTVIVAGDSVLLLDAPPDAEVSTTLWRMLRAGMGHAQVRAVLESYSPVRLPDLGVASLMPEGLTLLLRGPVKATTSAGGSVTDYSDEHGPLWTEFVVAQASEVRLWLHEPPTTGRLPLVGGVVRAGAVQAALAGREAPQRVVTGPSTASVPLGASPYAPPAPVPGPPPMDGVFVDRPDPAPVEVPAAIGSISQVWVTPGTPTPPAPSGLTGTTSAPFAPTEAAPRASGGAAMTARQRIGQRPAVWATRCSQAHLNPPEAPSCRVCGSVITDREPSIVPRPSLGRLEFTQLAERPGEAGAALGSVDLDSDLVIGREPAGPTSDGPRPVTIAHPSLSRNHVEIQIRDWMVVVVDLDSQNGTVVVPPGRAALPLRGRDPMPIVPGTAVWLAQQVCMMFVAGQ